MALPAQSSNDVAQAPQPTPRLLAFYLPQFHPTPENNVFWGSGFTEWTNVVRARPLFPGHYQPRLPADLGFYDLRLPEARQAQADLAREYGIHGFCYYHYWFGGRRVLERPFEEMLAAGEPDFPFCLCWANHNWTWRRDNRDKGRLVAQEYGEEEGKEHIRWLLDVFQDERYIKVNGRPLLLIYMVQDVPDPQRTFAMWREEARKAGVPEPYICKVESVGNFKDPHHFGCDASVEFWPHGVDRLVETFHTQEEAGRVNVITEYRDLVEEHLKREVPPFKRYPCIVPHWDNTARFKPAGARIIHGSTPELYERWLRGVIEKFATQPPEEQLIFINAWNEWGEGAYLEPDFKYGRSYLEATRRALMTSGVEVPADDRVKGKAPSPSSAEVLYSQLFEKYTQLQKRLLEQLSAEEHSPLVQKAERRIEELELKLEELRRERDEFRRNLRGVRAERDQLIRWMRQMTVKLSILFKSRRWRFSGIFSEIRRRILGAPRGSGVQGELSKITRAFHAWEKTLMQAVERKEDEVSGERDATGGKE